MRQGFRRSDLTGWIAMHRGELLAALLTLAAAWYAAGKPQGPACQIGSFEEWAGVLSGILAHAGVIGFLSNLDELYELADPAMQQWEAFLLAVRDQYGDETFTVAELTTRLQREAALKEQLPEDLTTAWGNNEAGSIGFKVKLGKALRNRAGTQFGVDGLHLNRAGTERKGGQGRWRVLAGMQGSQGSNLSKSRSAEDQHGRNNPANPATLHDEDGPRSEGGVEPPGKLLNNENPANAPCFVCKGTTFRALRNGGWVCEVCHPEGVQKSGH